MAALVAPTNNVLGMAVRARDTLVESLAWLWDAHLSQRIQGQDEHGGHEDEGLDGT